MLTNPTIKKDKVSMDDPGTAYAVIARCMKLRWIGERLYEDPKGKVYVLTPYGFQVEEVYNPHMEKEEQKKAYEHLLREKHAQIRVLEERLKESEKNEKVLEESKRTIHYLKEKVRVYEWRSTSQIEDDELRNCKLAHHQLQGMYEKLLIDKLNRNERLGSKSKTRIMNILASDKPDELKVIQIADFLAGTSPVFLAKYHMEAEEETDDD